MWIFINRQSTWLGTNDNADFRSNTNWNNPQTIWSISLNLKYFGTRATHPFLFIFSFYRHLNQAKFLINISYGLHYTRSLKVYNKLFGKDTKTESLKIQMFLILNLSKNWVLCTIKGDLCIFKGAFSKFNGDLCDFIKTFRQNLWNTCKYLLF